ncbi:MAG TPA: hypothetical protein DEG71_01495 [Clostridiales bacterium]|nr:hypothetical protein [Clostridiales bacterium]
MKKMIIFELSRCSQINSREPNIDKELIRISDMVDKLKKRI